MARNWMEPPAWWVKYKPLRWVLGALVLYWFFGTLMPRFKEDTPATAEPVIPAEQSVEPVASTPTPAPVAPPEIQKPPPVAPTTPPKPAPVAKPEPVKPPVIAAVPKPTPKPVPVTPPKPAPVTPPKTAPVVPKPAPTPAPAAKPAPPVQAQAKPTPVADPMARYSQVESERVALINGLRSYDSVEALQAQLEKSGYSVSASMIEKPHDSRYPPFRTDTLVVSNYKHAEFDGKLTLEFFNDRLYQTYFEPAKAADYLGWLRGRGLALPVKRTGRSSLTQGHLLISTNIDFATSDVGSVMRAKSFALWEDTRLTQQMKDWGPLR